MSDKYPDPYANLLLTLQQNGDESNFEALYDAYSAVLFGIILRIVSDQKEAENLLQDCFVKIWRNIKHYNPEKGRVATWLINIARHTAIDFIRSPYYKQKINHQDVPDVLRSSKELIVSQPTIESIGLKQLVEKLTPGCREVIERMYFEGYSQQEIADNFGIPLGTVKTRSRSALKELRTFFNLV
ncbi:MAG: sigma-70 family RNA polymerase sigma factor [Saprospiraceae bacterium]